MYVTDFYCLALSLFLQCSSLLYRFSYLVLIQKDIQRVRAKIHKLGLLSAARQVGVLELDQKAVHRKKKKYLFCNKQVVLRCFVFCCKLWND